MNQVKILLIEDNAADIEMTINALKKHNLGNQVKIIDDGQEALDYILEQCAVLDDCPYLILLDLKLPKVGGLEILKAIRANEKTKLIPVVALTSSEEERDRLESYRLGVNSYIVKPVEFDSFSRAVSSIGYYWVLMNKPAF